MAYTSVQSGEIPEGAQYYSAKLPLGDYNFYLSIDATGVSPKIVAKCVSPDGEIRTSASRTWPAGTQVSGWSVEANETEASVYVTLKPQEIKGGVTPPIASSTGTRVGSHVQDSDTIVNTVNASENVHWFCVVNGSTLTICAASASPESMPYVETSNGYVTSQGTQSLSSRKTIQGKTVFYSISTASMSGWSSVSYGCPLNSGTITATDAWLAVYQTEEVDGAKLVARFAIDLDDAGGYPGGGGGWISPGDWNPDPMTR